MTHLSRRKLSTETESEIINALKTILTKLTPSEVDSIFPILITDTEQVMIAKRLGIIFMLTEGATYDEISKALNLTEQTISRIHYEFNTSPKAGKLVFSKLTPWKRKILIKAIRSQ